MRISESAGRGGVGLPSPWGPYLPKWAPTWDMRNSTILYACNYSGPVHANKVVSF